MNEPVDNTAEKKSQPAMTVLSQYVKDLSFENPNAPGITAEMAKNRPQMNININVTNRMIEKDTFEVLLTVKARAEVGEKVGFVCEIDYGAAVRLANEIKPEVKEAILAVHVPQLIFPYARQLMSDATIQAGFPPLLINPVNFHEMLTRAKKKQAEKAGNNDDETVIPQPIADGNA